MGNIFTDTISFIKSLSFVDIVFMMSIIGLIVLIVTLIYIIKVNDEEEIDNTKIDEQPQDILEEINKEQPQSIVETTKTEEPKKEIIEEELDLSKITQELDHSSPKAIALNDYEREQEERAIISYDELLKTKDLQEEINYINEQNLGDLTVKSVDLDSITRPIELPKIREKIVEQKIEEEPKEEIKENIIEEPPLIAPIDETPKHSKTVLISYRKEEEFLIFTLLRICRIILMNLIILNIQIIQLKNTNPII